MKLQTAGRIEPYMVAVSKVDGVSGRRASQHGTTWIGTSPMISAR